MPTESLWVQFAVVAIVVMAIGVIWREMKKFIDEQDVKREAERERQRLWQEKQDKQRDERWQAFLKAFQDEYIKQDAIHTDAIQAFDEVITKLLEKFDDHDRFVRESIASMRERTSK